MQNDEEEVRYACVSWIERQDGRLLCVWNGRYAGWAMPGGLQEPGETSEVAQARELGEETGMGTASRALIFEGAHGVQAAEARGRASIVRLYRVLATGTPREMEIGRPITWLTREEFLKWSPFGGF